MLINKEDKIFIAGATGMVGKSIKDSLTQKKYLNLLTPNRNQLDLLKIADQKISECAENNLELEDISAELIAIQEQEIEDGNPIVTNVNGFDMAVQPVPKTEVGSLIKRQAIAKDSKGIIVLKGEPSFSASDQILIDELAFYITNNNLKA